MKRTLLSTVMLTAAMALAFRLELAGTVWFWAALGIPYAALAALALHKSCAKSWFGARWCSTS
jgi:hypothetical protein